jgi:hypothetical protein
MIVQSNEMTENKENTTSFVNCIVYVFSLISILFTIFVLNSEKVLQKILSQFKFNKVLESEKEKV